MCGQGVCICGRGVCMKRGGMHAWWGVHVWLGACMAGGMCDTGHAWQERWPLEAGSMHPTGMHSFSIDLFNLTLDDIRTFDGS